MLVFSLHSSILIWSLYTWYLVLASFGIIKGSEKKFRTIIGPDSLWFGFKLSFAWLETPALDFCRIIRVNLLKSSRMVRKYLYPWTGGSEMGPHMSKCKSSNLDLAWEELFVKSNFFCQEKWNISQTLALLYVIDGYKWAMWVILWLDKWPNLKFHKYDIYRNGKITWTSFNCISIVHSVRNSKFV